MKKRMYNEEIKKLNKLAVPLIIQSISGLLIGVADQMILGRISVYAYSTIGVIITLLMFLSGVLGYIAVSFNIIGSKAKGKKDFIGFQEEFMSSLLIDIVIGLFFSITIILFGKSILIGIYGFSGKELSVGLQYFHIMSLYIPIQLLLFTFGSYFKIIGNTKIIMICSITTSIGNVALNYILVFGKLGFKPMGAAGAAVSTIFSMTLNLIAYIMIANKDISLSFRKVNAYFCRIKKQIFVSLPLMGQELLEGSVVVVLINAIVARIGTVELAAYLLVKGIIDIALMAMYMYGSATLTLVSENVGSVNKDSMRKLPKAGIRMSLLIFIVIGAILVAFRDFIPKIISSDYNVVHYASGIMFVMIIMNFFNPLQEMYKYALQACGKGKYVLYITAAVNGVALLFICALTFILKWGLCGLFISLAIHYLILYLLFSQKYRKNLEVYH